MTRIRINLPLFSSPIDSFAGVFGVIDMDAIPQEGGVFPWPEDWLLDGPCHLSDDDQSRVWGVSAYELPGAELHVLMYGFVCSSVSDARDCADYFRRVRGLEVDEY